MLAIDSYRQRRAELGWSGSDKRAQMMPSERDTKFVSRAFRRSLKRVWPALGSTLFLVLRIGFGKRPPRNSPNVAPLELPLRPQLALFT